MSESTILGAELDGSVSRNAFERRLTALEAECRDPNAGLFGPGSAMWRVQRHSLIFLGSGRAALLQLAHPFVASAIRDHSATADDPWARFRGTFRQVFPMVFGSLDQAVGAARHVRRIHDSIFGLVDRSDPGGNRYTAHDRGALLWVHATLWDTSIRCYETFVGPLGEAEKESYYRETTRFAALFGLDPEEIPADWSAFRSYTEEMFDSSRLEVGHDATEAFGYLLGRRSPLPGPAAGVQRLVTAALLPERLRAAYGLRFGSVERRCFRAVTSMVRLGRRLLPPVLAEVPAYREASNRLAGSSRAGFLTRKLAELYVGRS